MGWGGGGTERITPASSAALGCCKDHPSIACTVKGSTNTRVTSLTVGNAVFLGNFKKLKSLALCLGSKLLFIQSSRKKEGEKFKRKKKIQANSSDSVVSQIEGRSE